MTKLDELKDLVIRLQQLEAQTRHHDTISVEEYIWKGESNVRYFKEAIKCIEARIEQEDMKPRIEQCRNTLSDKPRWCYSVEFKGQKYAEKFKEYVENDLERVRMMERTLALEGEYQFELKTDKVDLT